MMTPGMKAEGITEEEIDDVITFCKQFEPLEEKEK